MRNNILETIFSIGSVQGADDINHKIYHTNHIIINLEKALSPKNKYQLMRFRRTMVPDQFYNAHEDMNPIEDFY